MESLTLSHQDLCEKLFSVEYDKRNIPFLITYVSSKYPDLNEKMMQMVEEKLKHVFFRIFKCKLAAVFYSKDSFDKKNFTWLQESVTIDFNKRHSSGGRPPVVNFEEGSTSTKRRKIELLADTYSEEELKLAFYKKLRDSGKGNLVKIIEDLLENKRSNQITFSEEESLALIEDAKLSLWQYDTIRRRTKEKNADIFISYKNLGEARQYCYPPSTSIAITEKGAKIKLQALLNHTCMRLLQVPTVSSEILETDAEVSLIMTSKWGCDGASDHSQYKQKFSDGSMADSSIFMISMVPLTLEIQDENILQKIWSNPQSGSARYCRVISFEYAKETDDKTRFEVNQIQSEIDELLPTVLEIDGTRIIVLHQMHLTMLDGKVVTAITATPSNASCAICKATPKEMNDMQKLSKKSLVVENFKYGLSSLHAWIRCMECILHIAYRLEYKTWSARTDAKKESMTRAKERIQKEFRERVGLLVDYPRQGSGNSNDGNTARRFFRDPKLTSQITGVDIELIGRFAIILQTLACGIKIDSVKFKQYAKETVHIYLRSYDWFYMPSSVHKILIHGAEIIENFSLIPIGLLSEESQESRNKDVKHYRKFNTRKCNRIATNTDLIHKLLLSSDPYISSLRHKKKNTKLQIDQAAKDMLIDE